MSTISKRNLCLRAWTLLMVATAVICPSRLAYTQAADPMAPVAFLAGGTWHGDGKWLDGSTLKIEERYFWGPTRRVLHFETYDLTSEPRKLLYEGLLFFDDKRGKIVQWNFKPTGGHDESELTKTDGKGFEVRGENTWSRIHYTGADELHWELRVRQANEWKKLLDATYRRQK